MELITIAEFLHLTQLSHKDFVTMLENGELPISIGPTSELLIDISSLSPDNIALRSDNSHSSTSEENTELFEEMVASEIVNNLNAILDEALELAYRWKVNAAQTPNKSESD